MPYISKACNRLSDKISVEALWYAHFNKGIQYKQNVRPKCSADCSANAHKHYKRLVTSMIVSTWLRNNKMLK